MTFSTTFIASMCALWAATPVHATEYVVLSLHQRVEASDAVVLARVVDPERALVQIDRVLKGDTPKQITLTAYIGRFLSPEDRKPLVRGARELIFLTKRDDGFAPLQEQYGRLSIVSGRLEGIPGPRSLADTLALIERLVAAQARAARGGRDADDAYVAAFRHQDANVREWALDTVYDRIKVPSTALADALLAYWPADVGAVANAMYQWRLRRAAPLFARTLTSSDDGEQRAYAAMALGGTGDDTYVSLLRRVASTDPHPHARALALRGIVWMIGPVGVRRPARRRKGCERAGEGAGRRRLAQHARARDARSPISAGLGRPRCRGTGVPIRDARRLRASG